MHPTTGCSKSHLKALQMARDANYPNVLIVEDDAYWSKVDETYPILKKLMQGEYDGIMLGSIGADYDPETYLLRGAASTTAYIVNQAFYPKLIELFEKSLSTYNPAVHTDKDVFTTADGVLKESHGLGKWYVVAPSLMMQVPSYSNITHPNDKKIFSNSRELFT
jgi:GR25 family glycosyltransferase involved in LPS biosynthesis